MRGVWDDTAAATDEASGGNCLAPGRAQQLFEQLKNVAEMVEVEVSHDTSSKSFCISGVAHG